MVRHAPGCEERVSEAGGAAGTQDAVSCAQAIRHAASGEEGEERESTEEWLQ